MYICLLLENQLLCQQAAVIAKQLGHISIHIPSLIRIEGGLVGESNFERRFFPCMSINICLVPQKSALVPASRYNCNVAMPYNNTHAKFQ